MKKDYNRKIFLDGVLGLQYADLNQILKILKKRKMGKWKIEVLEMDKLRIATVRLTSPPFRSIRVEEIDEMKG